MGTTAKGCGLQPQAPGTSQATTCGQAAAAAAPQAAHRPLDRTEMDAWRAFLQASTTVTAALNHELEERAGISLYEYEILVRLSEAEDECLRMSTLAQDTSHSRSRLTHTVSRLEKAGYVTRSSCASDRRGVYCHLTQEGTTFLAKTASMHLDGVRRHVINHIPSDKLPVLTELLSALVRPDPAGAATSCGEQAAKKRA